MNIIERADNRLGDFANKCDKGIKLIANFGYALGKAIEETIGEKAPVIAEKLNENDTIYINRKGVSIGTDDGSKTTLFGQHDLNHEERIGEETAESKINLFDQLERYSKELN